MRVKSLFVVLAFVAFESQASERCMSATRPLSAGSVPSAEDFVAANCDGRSQSAVRYDATMRTARLTRDLAPGDVIAEIPSSVMAAVSPGQKLYVNARVGPVLVQREVAALQPANPGQKLFVRAADGEVMTALYSGEAR